MEHDTQLDSDFVPCNEEGITRPNDCWATIPSWDSNDDNLSLLDDTLGEQALTSPEEIWDDDLLSFSEASTFKISIIPKETFPHYGAKVPRIYYDENIKLEVNVLGYPEKGESIIFALIADGNLNYCGIVDCYQTKLKRVLNKLITQSGISTFNFVCCTHPHQDHLNGMIELLKNNTTPQTVLLIPSDIERETDKLPKCAQEFFSSLQQITTDRIFECSLKKARNHMNAENVLLIPNGERNPRYVLRIDSLSPIDEVVSNLSSTTDTSKINDYSIALALNLATSSFLLTGDIENETLTALLEHGAFPSNIVFLKIPHHASPSSSVMCQLLQQYGETPHIAVATSYRSHGLPDNDILEQYAKICKEVYISSNYDKNTSSRTKYGIIKTTLAIKPDETADLSTHRSGSAYQFCSTSD